MAENVHQSVEVPVPLSLFGSLDSELAPADIPEGISPDNQDVVYLPGSVASRPCLNKIYPTLGTATIQYFKSFTRNDGTVYNLILDSTGKLWVENLTSEPGVLTILDTVSPGSYASSVKAFNKEWIVFHNGINGTDNPRQFDGTYLDPVTQDGPGGPCSPVDHQDPSDISNIVPILVGAITSILQKGNVVTVETDVDHNLIVGQKIIVAGTSPSVESQKVVANTAAGSSSLVVTSITDLTGYGWYPGMILKGAGISSGTTILSIAGNPSGTATSIVVTMSQNATATANGITVGVLVTYNGPTQVQTRPTPNSFTYLLAFTGLDAGSDGNVYLQKALCATSTPHKGIIGDAVMVQKASVFNSISTTGPMTVHYWCSTGDSDSNPLHPSHFVDVGKYVWKNPADAASNGTVLDGTGGETGNNTGGNSLLFDSPLSTVPTSYNPMLWSVFSTVTAGLVADRIPLFTPAVQDDGQFNNFQFILTGKFYVPSAGQYRFTGKSQHDMLFGIQGATVVSNNNGGQTTGTKGQTMTPLGGFPLIPRKFNPGNATTTLDATVSFDAPGEYDFEVAYDYWYHSGRTLQILCNGTNIAPLEVSSTQDNPYDTNVNGNPERWVVSNVTSDTELELDLTGITTSAVNLADFGNPSGIGKLVVGGMLTTGRHGVVVMFLTRQGYLTAPSTPTYWESSGNCKVKLTNLAIGPSNVIARVIGFTGSAGGSFFTLPDGITLPTAEHPTVVPALMVPDNASTEATLDFSDTALFMGVGIDILGNNLFNQSSLGPAIGVFFYGSRLVWWGHRNKITNMLNMGFEGGYYQQGPDSPLGWTVASGGGTIIPRDFGLAWRIVGDGLTKRGTLRQKCDKDYYQVPILKPGVAYSVSIWGQAESPGAGGNIILKVTDGNTVFSSSSIPVVDFGSGKILIESLTPPLPESIPEGAYFELYADEGLGAGQSVVVDDLQLIPTTNLISNKMILSYVNNPEALDFSTGILASADDPTPIQTVFEYHDNLYILSSRSLHETSVPANLEPSKWELREMSSRCGGSSPMCCDSGENFSIWMSNPSLNPPTGRGGYVFTGGQVYKISQEVQSYFDTINPQASHLSWVKNDPVNRRAYFGLPTGQAMAPNVILVLDYRELDTASDLANRAPVHISFTGKMVCSDLSRKWTRWNVKSNYAGTMITPTAGIQFCFGSGNGGVGDAYGNIYWLNPDKFTDDDYGKVNPYYTTYFFVNHEMEQSIGVGVHRKLFKRYAAFITGVGKLVITPLANSLDSSRTPPPSWTLSTSEGYDVGGGLNISSERCAFKIASTPLPGETDNSFNLQKFIITLSQEPVAPIRFGAV